ncbi:hypothetical protein BH10BAC2_BH10BAC2_39690 [soil metagenome]
MYFPNKINLNFAGNWYGLPNGEFSMQCYYVHIQAQLETVAETHSRTTAKFADAFLNFFYNSSATLLFYFLILYLIPKMINRILSINEKILVKMMG